MQLRPGLRGFALCLFASTASMGQGAAEGLKPFVIDDIYRLEAFGSAYRFSPDGRYLAFMRKRPVDTEPEHAFLFSNDRSDIWLFDRRTGQTRNLTDGATNRADYWYPSWSPDSKRLAMVKSPYSERGATQLWLWDSTSDKLAQMGDRDVELDNDERTSSSDNEIHWVSNSQVMFPSRPKDVRSIEPRTGRQYMWEIMDYWNTSLQGTKPTAVAFDAGVVQQKSQLIHGKTFVSCHINSGRCTDVADIYAAGFYGFMGPMRVPSPDGQLMAALTVESKRIPDPVTASQRYTSNVYSVHVFDQERERILDSLSRLQNVAPASLRWAEDGRRLAFVGSFDPDWNFVPPQGCADMRGFGVFILDVQSGKLESADLSMLRPLTTWRWGFPCQFHLNWAGDRLLLKAEAITRAAADKPQFVQGGWWEVGAGKRPVSVTSKLGFVPDSLYPAADGKSLVYVRESNLWALAANGQSRKLTDHQNADHLSVQVVWTDRDIRRGGRVGELVYELRDSTTAMLDGGRTTVYHVDLRRQQVTAIPVPAVNATFGGFSSISRDAVFTQSDRTGTRLWLAGVGASAARQIVETNTLLQGIAEGEMRSFEYVSMRGEKLTAGLMLPVGYQEGQRYPLVTWVYQRAVQQSRHSLSSIATINPLNLQPLASRGYAVLFPSMPGGVKEYDKLLNGVMPAVDRAIDMGIADPQRLAVMGQSNGGFSTYGLVTLTPRFKAAIALAGMTDMSSIVLQFEGNYLSPQAVEVGETEGRFAFKEGEHGFGLPWKSALYAQNSPLTYVEKVQTPVLQLHGDLDGAPIQQAQAFFIAMQRLGKRARLVQYMGDDHVLQSPANAKNSWQEIFGWLEAYLVK